MNQQADIDRLILFHSTHFPRQPIPNLTEHHLPVTEEVDTSQNTECGDDDGLGYYEDGVKRTLSDEQIKMFRHSEIQRLLTERRAAREKEEKMRSKKERAINRPDAVERRKRRFEDRPPAELANVDTLMYDDAEDPSTQTDSSTKKFIWPKIAEA